VITKRKHEKDRENKSTSMFSINEISITFEPCLFFDSCRQKKIHLLYSYLFILDIDLTHKF